MVKEEQRATQDLMERERRLEQREKEFERRISSENWGEGEGKHEVKMEPLVTHKAETDHKNDVKSPLLALAELMSGIAKTGPAQAHHAKPLIPTHNILKPGAHPKHLKKGFGQKK